MRILLAAFVLLLAFTATAAADDLSDADAAYEKGDYATALRLWRPYAEAGLVGAQFNLGLMYNKGEGVAQDYAEAVKWFRKAAEQGEVKAQHNLSIMYGEGRGVPQDYAEAVKWRRRAAEQGSPLAQCSLGTMYEMGNGMPQDFVQAHKWYNLAAARHTDQEDRKRCGDLRNYIASRMTLAQVAEAQRLAREWRPKPASPFNAVPEASPPSQREAAPRKPPPKAELGDSIAAAQEALRQLGYDPGPVDGIIGSKTREAVKAFERDHSMPETGQVTPLLIQQMSRAFYKRT